jgi:hypothetical protein
VARRRAIAAKRGRSARAAVAAAVKGSRQGRVQPLGGYNRVLDAFLGKSASPWWAVWRRPRVPAGTRSGNENLKVLIS